MNVSSDRIEGLFRTFVEIVRDAVAGFDPAVRRTMVELIRETGWLPERNGDGWRIRNADGVVVEHATAEEVLAVLRTVARYGAGHGMTAHVVSAIARCHRLRRLADELAARRRIAIRCGRTRRAFALMCRRRALLDTADMISRSVTSMAP